MHDQRFWRTERAAGLFLVLGCAANLTGVLMFWFRDGVSGRMPPSPAYYTWERSFILAAVVLTAIGFVLLEEHPNLGDGRVLARTGAIAYLFAGVLGVLYEAIELTRTQNLYPVIVVYVVLAFLAQAAIGGGLRQARLLAPWIGWATILWNLAWLLALPLLTPRDIYYPVLHHAMPLLIGAALLRQSLFPRGSPRQTGPQEATLPQ
ncbi:MAG TPA: hypothetical protein VFU22_22750 [Roseiflexaceae bacterium]|nr:hypothetical protein [Roseiflexaceae bacterium]